ncbi:DUF5996 family protein [Dyella humicola]|uniref:DUF5996 family protein n=1 Tax=Dyella humicola TaxID=2992126 RepID=UPI002256B324|nr:DUF5996 family protein [Dyella humicola]
MLPAPGICSTWVCRLSARLIEMGWWTGNTAYPRPAFYSFSYPQPAGIEDERISPSSARWDPAMGEFIFDDDELPKSKDPDGVLLSFFRSAFNASAERAGWDPKLMGSGRPD